jgi:hypothetical protein
MHVLLTPEDEWDPCSSHYNESEKAKEQLQISIRAIHQETIIDDIIIHQSSAYQ